MSKKQFAAGLSGLLANAQKIEETPAPAAQAPEKAKNKTVCYSLPLDVIEGIKYIAYYDRRHLNAVVSEAFAEYIERWNNKEHKIEKPQKI